jgi:hypothetical protein
VHYRRLFDRGDRPDRWVPQGLPTSSAGVLVSEIRSPFGQHLHAEAVRDTGNDWRVLLRREERRR